MLKEENKMIGNKTVLDKDKALETAYGSEDLLRKGNYSQGLITMPGLYYFCQK